MAGRLLGNSDQFLFLYKLPFNKYSMRSNDDFGNIMQKFNVIILFLKNKLKDTCMSILLGDDVIPFVLLLFV